MNILVDNFTFLIKYQDGDFILKADSVEHYSGDNLLRVIGDMNENNSTVYSVTEIEGFIGGKYKYIDGEIVINPDYMQPEE